MAWMCVLFAVCYYYSLFLFILNVDFYNYLVFSGYQVFIVLHKNLNLFEEKGLYLAEIEKLY